MGCDMWGRMGCETWGARLGARDLGARGLGCVPYLLKVFQHRSVAIERAYAHLLAKVLAELTELALQLRQPQIVPVAVRLLQVGDGHVVNVHRSRG